jgi:hypothetical protein
MMDASPGNDLHLLRLGSRELMLDGHVLEVFSALHSQARLLLRDVAASVEGPDRKGRHELRVTGADGALLFDHRVEAGELEAAIAFAEQVRAASARRAAGHSR